MNRAKRSTIRRKKHKSILKEAKGFYGKRKNCFSIAVRAVKKARKMSYIGRKVKKHEMRRLWISKISEYARGCGSTYSKMIKNLKSTGLNRKQLYKKIINFSSE